MIFHEFKIKNFLRIRVPITENHRVQQISLFGEIFEVLIFSPWSPKGKKSKKFSSNFTKVVLNVLEFCPDHDEVSC